MLDMVYSHGLLQPKSREGTSYKFRRVEDSKPQHMGVPCTIAACITGSPLSQLKEILEQRTTISKHSSLESIQHISTEKELSLV